MTTDMSSAWHVWCHTTPLYYIYIEGLNDNRHVRHLCFSTPNTLSAKSAPFIPSHVLSQYDIACHKIYKGTDLYLI